MCIYLPFLSGNPLSTVCSFWLLVSFFCQIKCLPGFASTATPTLPTRNRVWWLVCQKGGRDRVPKNGANPRGSLSRPANNFCNSYPWHKQHCGWEALRTRLQLTWPRCLLFRGANWLQNKRRLFSPKYLTTATQTSCSASFNEGFRLLLPNREAHSCEPSTLQVHKRQEPKKRKLESKFPPQVLPCNDRPCPVDCRWDHWSPWSPCTGRPGKRSPGNRVKRQSGACSQSR